MRRILLPRHALALGLLAALATLAGAGPFGGGSRRKPHVNPIKPLKADETIGDLALISSAAEVPIQGVGLVVHLDGTGSDPEPSHEREKLLDEMRKSGVDHPEKLLASPAKTYSLVLVKGRIPAGVTTDDRLDVEVSLTPNSTTKSLAGGWLIATKLTEVLIGSKGDEHESAALATAWGPVMIGSEQKADDARAGRVLGGCRIRKDMPYTIVIDSNHRSIRTAALIQNVINQRFHQGGVDQPGMAEAKKDFILTLKVPKVYHHNQFRYFRVVKLLPVLSDPTVQAQRIEKWGKELLEPKTAGLAALKLEGAGPNAVETLKKGLASDNAQVRFLTAEALAYLDDSSGTEELAQTAIAHPEFRAFALAALAAMDQAAATLRLRRLMDEADVQVRYGAFNALRTQDPHDAFLGQVRVLEDEPDEGSATDTMAMSLQSSLRRHRRRSDDPFSLYMVDSEGPPLVHITRNRRCEIVVFGRGQKLLTPVVLGAGGSILLNAADGDTSLQVSRIVPSKFEVAERKLTVPLELGEVIREVAQLGATYPEIVAILQAAEKQKNLPGPLVVDAVPGVDPNVDAALLFGKDLTAKPKKDDAVKTTKGESEAPPRRWRLFDRFRRSPAPAPKPAAPASQPESEAKSKPKAKS